MIRQTDQNKSNGNGEKILIVDDLDSNRMLLRAILKSGGYEVDECADGQACLEYCRKTPPSLVVLDVMMPIMDGIEACRQIRMDWSKEQLPIVILTARTESEDVARGLSVGANDYISKPIDRVVLIARVENQLAIRQANKNLAEEKSKVERSLMIQNTVGNVLPEAIAVAGANGEIVGFNQEIRRFCGSVVPTNINELLKEMFDRGLSSYHDEILKLIASNSSAVIEREVVTKNVEPLDVQILTKPIVLSDKTEMRLWMWRDITHTRALEKKIKQQIKLNTVSLFATGVAHNFNNIMGGIRGAAEIMQRIVSGDRVGERCLDIIQRGIEQGAKLTHKMMVMSGPDSVHALMRSTELVGILDRVVEPFKSITGDRINFQLQLDSELPALNISRHNLIDILNSVISNSVDAISEKGIITIRAEPEPNKRFVKVSISDTGHGMDSEALEKVYEPFFTTKHLDEANGISMVGNGLGMWNVYNLVQMAGGEIEIQSEPEQGTQVSMHLPVSKL